MTLRSPPPQLRLLRAWPMMATPRSARRPQSARRPRSVRRLLSRLRAPGGARWRAPSILSSRQRQATSHPPNRLPRGGRSPAGALPSRCFCCRDGWRALARTNVIGTRAAICGSTKPGCAAAYAAYAASLVVRMSTRVEFGALRCAMEAGFSALNRACGRPGRLRNHC